MTQVEPKANFFDIVKSMVSKNKEQGKNEQLTIGQLRYIENGSAKYIQKMIRGTFTRKWYKAYQKRKNFGVPFSGIEITMYPFLRQFARLNMDLHSDYKREEEKKADQSVSQKEKSEFQKLKGMSTTLAIVVYNIHHNTRS